MSKKWDPHKEEIIRLYIVENLTVDQVMAHMSQMHGFHQKKPQYEYRLKLWDARKNIKKEVLEYISHQDRKRRPSQDPNAGTYVVDGIILSESRVKRARYRHNLDLSLARKYGRAPSPKLPPGHIIRITNPPASVIVIDWPESLPWLRFEERFNSAAPQTSRFIQVLARAAHSYGLVSGMGIGESSDLARTIYAASHDPQSSADILAHMLSCIPNSSQSSMADIHLSTRNDVATNILKAFLFGVANNVHKDHNDEVGWEKSLLLLFQELGEADPKLLDYFIDSQGPTAVAIIDTLYAAAVEYDATALVLRLLKTGRDANALLPIYWSCEHYLDRGKAEFYFCEDVYPMTALQSAASTCNTQLATALIHAGAKADLGEPTPLQILCLSSETGHSDALHFAHLLISNGAEIDTLFNGWHSPLEGAVMCRNGSLVCFLLQQGATDVLHWRRNYDGAGLHHRPLKFEGCEFLLPGKKDTGAPGSALQLAIVTGDDSIVKALLSSITTQEDVDIELLEEALITTCAAGDKDSAEAIMRNLDSELEDYTTLIDEAFFTTAWDRDSRIAQLLVKQKAIDRTLQNACLSIFQAAALHGNVNLIKLLHSSGFDMNSGSSLRFGLRKSGLRPTPGTTKHFVEYPSPPENSCTPLGCSIWMGHKHATETLWSLGADTSGINLITAMRSGSSGLITQAIDRCDSINNVCNGQSALDIAIQMRTGLTVIHKLIDAGASLRGHELVDAVRTNDQEILDFLLPNCNIVAMNPRGENVLEVAICIGNLVMVERYFSCGGVYGSRALLLAVSRAVKMCDYHFVEYIVSRRHPGPVDAFEASALAISMRMNDSKTMDILLHCAFKPSNALSNYCGRFEYDPQDFKNVVESAIRPPDYEDSSLDIEEIVARKCLMQSYCEDHFSPLLVAAAIAPEPVVKKMLDHGYSAEPRLIDLVHSPSFTRVEVRDMILSAHISQIPNVADHKWQQRMLLVALKHRMDLGIVQHHFSKLPSLDFEHQHTGDWATTNPLQSAISSGSRDHVRAVLEAGATASARKWPPIAETFVKAVLSGDMSIVSLLLDHGADINYDLQRTFMLVVYHTNLRTLSFLLDHGLDINAPPTESKGRTCLELAAEYGTLDAVAMLLSRGLNIQGRARVHLVRSVAIATRKCHYAVVKLLKERGGWNDEDDELAKTHRGRETDHTCPRFLYHDLTLKECRRCVVDVDDSSVSDFSESGGSEETPKANEADEEEEQDEGEDAIDSPYTYGDAGGHFASHETIMDTGNMSVLDFESEFIDYGHINETPDIPYGQQNMELDMSILSIGSESSYHQHTNRVHEWPAIPYGQQDVELDAIVRELLLEDGMIS